MTNNKFQKRFWILDTGFWMLDVRCWMLDTRCYNIMRKLNYLILTLTLISCGQKIHRDKTNFNVIEITYCNGWTGGLTVNIDS